MATDARGHELVPGSWWPWLGRWGAKSLWMPRLRLAARPKQYGGNGLNKLEQSQPSACCEMFLYEKISEIYENIIEIHLISRSVQSITLWKLRKASGSWRSRGPSQADEFRRSDGTPESELINSENFWWQSENLMIWVNMIGIWLDIWLEHIENEDLMTKTWSDLIWLDLKYLEISGGLKWMCRIPSYLVQGNENTQ